MTEEDRIACRTPTEGRDGVTRIPAWKYHLVRKAILHAVDAAGLEMEVAGEIARAPGPGPQRLIRA